MTTQFLALNELRIDGGTQMREALDQAVVADYAEAITEGATFPPGVAFFDGSDYWMADGIHRLFAHRKIGALSMPVEVRAGTQRDARLYAAGANHKHGLRRTRETMRRSVLTLLADEEWSQWSDREIARRCGVSPDTVGRLRGTRSEPEKQQRQYKTKHGRTAVMDTSGIGVKTTTATPPDTSAQQPGPVTSHTTPPASSLSESDSENPEKNDSSLSESDSENSDATADFDPVAELEAARAEIDALNERIAALTVDDTKAELDKQIKIRIATEARLSQTTDKVHDLDKQLRQFGKLLEKLRKATGQNSNAGVLEAVKQLVAQAA